MNDKPTPEVAEVVGRYPKRAQRQFLALRKLVARAASGNESIGPLTETLKWGEPAYLTEKSKSGSTVRIAWKARSPDAIGIYFNCQTTLIDHMRTQFPELRYVGNREISVPLDAAIPEQAITECVSAALTYHLDKRARKAEAG